MKKSRQSNIEILRIIAIMLIIMFHYVFKCKYIFETFTFNAFLVKAIYMFGELGVNLFILITGYFMCKSKFSLKKLIILICETQFYYILLKLVQLKLGIIQTLSIKEAFLMFFPVILNKYWFITAYILTYTLSPFYNTLIKKMGKRTYQKLLAISLLIWCVIPTTFGAIYNTTENLLCYNRFIWLTIMYFTGGYIKIHQPKISKSLKNSLKLAVFSYGLMLISILVIQKFNILFSRIGIYETAYFWRPNTILMFILSVSLFTAFLNIRVDNNKMINKIASTTLGIYILHDGELQDYMWNTIFKTSEQMMKSTLIIHILLTTIIIFIVGAIIDLLRQQLEKHTLIKLLESKKYDQFIKKCNKFFLKLSKSI